MCWLRDGPSRCGRGYGLSHYPSSSKLPPGTGPLESQKKLLPMYVNLSSSGVDSVSAVAHDPSAAAVKERKTRPLGALSAGHLRLSPFGDRLGHTQRQAYLFLFFLVF